MILTTDPVVEQFDILRAQRQSRKYGTFYWGPISAMWSNRSAWLTLWGHGVHWLDHRRHRPLFSERNGHERAAHVRHHHLALIKPG